MRYSWEYGSSFSASPDLQSMLSGWYNAGTEAIFMCGGSMFQSGVAAAEANEGKIIGVDVDQSASSETVITSATKGLAESVIEALTKFYDGGAVYGGDLKLGAADNAVGIPTDTWSFENFTVDDYNALYEKIVAGEIEIDDDSEMADPSTAGLDNLKFVS